MAKWDLLMAVCFEINTLKMRDWNSFKRIQNFCSIKNWGLCNNGWRSLTKQLSLETDN